MKLSKSNLLVSLLIILGGIANAADVSKLTATQQAPTNQKPVNQKSTKLAQTEWFQQQAKDCAELDLASWRHPVRAVLIERGAKITRVQLCQQNRYPVIDVDLPYDPQGQTSEYFAPLYQALGKANGSWSMALISTNDQQVIALSFKGKNVNVQIEGFAE